MEDHLKLARDLAELVGRDIDKLNDVREILHESSPMRDHPIDFVKWVPAGELSANDYNPNVVAPAEMRLLETSIVSDGFTQPIVVAGSVVVDGFHRSELAKGPGRVKDSTKGYAPVVGVRPSSADEASRMASTVRHNRARGKHAIAEMVSMVVSLTRKGWDDKRVSKELGMDADEVLRLKQVSGLADLFADGAFSASWEPCDAENVSDETQE